MLCALDVEEAQPPTRASIGLVGPKLSYEYRERWTAKVASLHELFQLTVMKAAWRIWHELCTIFIGSSVPMGDFPAAELRFTGIKRRDNRTQKSQ